MTSTKIDNVHYQLNPKLPSSELKDYRYVTINGCLKMLHRVRAENALGKSLPPKSVVHHVDDTCPDDSPLVICQDQAYHRHLHMRARIVKAGGNPNTQRFCCTCKRLLDLDKYPPSVLIYPRECRECNTRNAKERRAARLEGGAS